LPRVDAAFAAAIFAAAFGCASAAQIPAPEPGRVAVIDDASDGEALLGRFDYVGRWQHVRGKFDGRSNGTSTRSTHTGDVAIVRFEGTRIRLYGVRGPSGGRAGIALDLESTGKPVDFYAPAVEPHALIYTSPELLPGVHTLSLVVWGLRDEHARFYYVNIDTAEIESAPPPVPRTANADRGP